MTIQIMVVFIRYSQLNEVEEDINELDKYKLTSSITVKKMKGGEDKRSSITSNGINNSLKGNEETKKEKVLFDIKMIPQSQSQTENVEYYGKLIYFRIALFSRTTYVWLK